MKKIFTVCAALVAAMTLSAEPIVKTCAEAAAIALALPENNVPTEEVYSITGYVTNVVGAVSKGQQTFWMDDEKGDKKTFESYYCNLPADDQNTLNVGDQVKIVGKIMKYNTTPEMKNGDITIIERAVVKRDTFTVTTCEAYDECTSLDDGDASVDIFIVKDEVVSVDDANENYGWQNITFKCEDEKLLVGYHIDFGGKDNFCAVGDTVEIIGNLKKYGEKMEIEGKGKVVAKGQVVVDTIEVVPSKAYEVGMALANGTTSTDVYVVTGYVDSIASAYSEQYKNMSFFMCDDMANPTYDFEAFQITVPADNQPKVGDKVKVTGNILHYYAAAKDDKPELHTIEIKKGDFEFVAETALPSVKAGHKAVKSLVNGQLVIMTEEGAVNVLGTVVR
ncbi:MAG: hypothetical protein MJZ84_08320 [Paludibacteraceae bacterium]|nr:hypothetical protein [Paludibacteraceae bacterium]